MATMKTLPLNSKLRQARTNAGLTQGQLASFIGSSSTYVYLLESGRKTNPSLIVLKKWAKACGLGLKELL